jgi:hypothetical protein
LAYFTSPAKRAAVFRSGVAGTSYASAFNPDYWAQTGLLMLGSPLLLTGFLLGGALSS